jgi:PAS domain-containing protein
MTHYYGNQFSRSDLSDGEILQKTVEITPLQQPVADRENQPDRHLNAIPHIVWHANADGAMTYLNSAWEEYTVSAI